MYVIGQNSIQVRIFQCCLIPNFLCLVTLIHEWLGQGDSKLNELKLRINLKIIKCYCNLRPITCIYMLQVKFDFQLKFVNLG